MTKTEAEHLNLIPVEEGPELLEVLRRYPLPDGVPDADMNLAEMAAALRTTVNTLAKWCDDETFPVVQRGGMGKSYVLRLSHCYAWQQAREASEADRRAQNQKAIAAMQRQFLNIDTGPDDKFMTAAQRREWAQAELAWMQAAQRRTQLCEIRDVKRLFESVLTIVRNGMESLPDRMERELSLKPEEVRLVDRAVADVLNAMVQEIETSHLLDDDLADMPSDQGILI